MKKFGAQIGVAFVCCILGFMIAHQLKIVSFQDTKQNTGMESAEISEELNKLSKEKSDLQKKVNELQSQVKGYQNAAASSGSMNKQIVNELNTSNMLIGSVDVTGPGIILVITPQNISSSTNNSTGQNNDVITGEDLLYLINELNFSQAEAISINDVRITSMTGIRSSSGGSDIFVGDDRISPYEKITIKAIGDSKLLYSALSYPGVLSSVPSGYKADYDKYGSIKIGKTNKVIKFDYAKPISK
ncbi:uncharacterized protein YlxW (UPF0749 family) [Clostridium acetobutylicum]|uniref:Conserved membrane protein n=2 Tax=Clostridium acetobutylicum TaxID=1488 RepID=Q97H89_CLOAB|nr:MULTISPECIES: DUF881 domain-containing protein [Clostridium]AAK80082.1 Conserved membrane protein [Clostridium acetobutylicum ATCC 824]ADZ21175.1 Conserved hypothetical protein [Clostridium acetobutylicum EA 2018]AEI32192.1 hypothetical protein SMB_G2157 [Clostridium acetobutylicum DSM 1731]AWV79491.1 DUF881 domain-containing protein [Clostridium acetobutylicum]MBC2394536.1 DUF881 domain-containing protein [Clostridium acetobutylicum]